MCDAIYGIAIYNVWHFLYFSTCATQRVTVCMNKCTNVYALTNAN